MKRNPNMQRLSAWKASMGVAPEKVKSLIHLDRKMGSNATGQTRKTEQTAMIAFLGITGSGKTTLIRSIANSAKIEAGHGLESDTQEITSYKTNINGGNFILVDTPGFDDTYRNETQVLTELAQWLSTTYRDGRKLTGLVYVHPIRSARVEGTARLNLRVFSSLCGSQTYANITLCTTFWDVTEENIGNKREEQLRQSPEFWGRLIEKGAKVRRIRCPDDARSVASEYLGKAPTTLAIQKEIVDKKRTLEDTAAGRLLNAELRRAKQQLKVQAERTKNKIKSRENAEWRRQKRQQLVEVTKLRWQWTKQGTVNPWIQTADCVDEWYKTWKAGHERRKAEREREWMNYRTAQQAKERAKERARGGMPCLWCRRLQEAPKNLVMYISNARLRDRDGMWDIEVVDGKIASIEENNEGRTHGKNVYDAKGYLATPQFCENHIHLDYANTAGKPRDNESGTLFEGIDIWRERKKAGLNNAEEIKANALLAIRSCVRHGVGFIRSHADVTDPSLTSLRVLLELKNEVKDWCEIQIVAFPQNGIFAFPRGKELMEEAMAMGADVVGGIPHLEPSHEDGVNSLKFIFDLAQTYNAMVDVHCDEIDDEQSRFVDVMAAETTKRGMQGRVTVSHAVAMGYYSPGYMARLLPKLVESGVGFANSPRENLQLQGRGFGVPTPRGTAPVRTLVDWDIRVSFCQDSICDPWYPIGDGNPLRNLDSGMHVGHMLTTKYMDRCLDFITRNPAVNLGLADRYGLEVGKPANFIILGAESDRDALQNQPVVLLSVHNGKEVFRQTAPTIEWKQ